jgi:hypothetical protein
MALWQTAHEKMVEGRKILDFLVTHKGAGAFGDRFISGPILNMWNVDRHIISNAVPFAFTNEVLQALGQAAVSVPMETSLVQENLPEDFSWWFFETPLPIITTLSTEPIVAMSMGRIKTSFIISCWTRLPLPPRDLGDTIYLGEVSSISPSQVFTWQLGETMETMLGRCREEHRSLYGPGGQYHQTEIVGEEVFMDATEKIARLILAAVVWLKQRIAVTDEKRVDRAERRRIFKASGKEPMPVKIVYLRRTVQSEHIAGEPTGREYSCRWVVEGHWRLQPYGPQRSERKLLFIDAYVKGPGDKPLKVRPTAYVVNR